MESNIHALVLLNLLNSLRKRDKMLGKPRILSFFPTRLINSIKHEHSCKILYLLDMIELNLHAPELIFHTPIPANKMELFGT